MEIGLRTMLMSMHRLLNCCLYASFECYIVHIRGSIYFATSQRGSVATVQPLKWSNRCGPWAYAYLYQLNFQAKLNACEAWRLLNSYQLTRNIAA